MLNNEMSVAGENIARIDVKDDGEEELKIEGTIEIKEGYTQKELVKKA